MMFTCLKRYPVQQFCCGCNLRSGCLIIGIIEFIFAVIQIVLLFLRTILHLDQNVLITSQVIFCIFTLFISISLLIGVGKNDKKYLIPWLILKEISCIIGTVVAGITFIIALTEGQYLLFVTGFSLIIVLGIFYYFWNCVWSFYIKLDTERHYIEPLLPLRSTIEMAQWLQKHRISQFCCSCPVRTGTLVVGIFEVLGALSQIIFLFVNLDDSLSGGDAAYGGQIASCVLSFIVGLTVLWGVHSRNKDFLLPYLVLRVISWILINFAIGVSDNMHENIEHVREKFRIERFCCCTELRIGCYIIGGIGWILSIVKIYLIANRTTLSENSTVTYYDIEYKVCYVVITLITCIALIWGAHKRKKSYLVPWLILRCFESVLMIIVTIVFFVLIFFANDYLLMAILTFFIFVIGTCVSWYFWICVWNFYHTVGDIYPNAVGPGTMDDIDIEKESHMA
ncbi:hypothetical protein CBL_01158 [Carabus blaptoides fortunei]